MSKRIEAHELRTTHIGLKVTFTADTDYPEDFEVSGVLEVVSFDANGFQLTVQNDDGESYVWNIHDEVIVTVSS